MAERSDDTAFNFRQLSPKRRGASLPAAVQISRLRLTLHPGAHPQPVTEGIPFLGFTVYPHRRRLKRRKGIHFQRKLRALVAQCEAGEIPLAALTARIRSWVEHLRHGNTVGLRKAILGKIRLKPGPFRDGAR